MTSVEDIDLSPAADAAARIARGSDVVARCVRAECATLLREADAAASGDVGGSYLAVVEIMSMTLTALRMYVSHGDDPGKYLTGVATRLGTVNPVHPDDLALVRSADRIAARVAVETERDRLGEARRAAKGIYDSHRADVSSGRRADVHAQSSWEAYGIADRAFREYNAAHPEGT